MLIYIFYIYKINNNQFIIKGAKPTKVEPK